MLDQYENSRTPCHRRALVPMTLSGQNTPSHLTEEIAVCKTTVIAVAAIMMLCALSQGNDVKEKASVVTAIDKESLLKYLKLTPVREDVGEAGWSVANIGAKKGEVFQLAIAVCDSAQSAQALYRHQRRYLAVKPQAPQGQSTIGDDSTIGQTWALFVRDNVFASIRWKESFDRQALERLDKHLVAGSAFVTRGQFGEVPRLGDIPEKKVLLAAGQTKVIPITWNGMGKASPAMWVSSPGDMSNHVADATVQLRMLPGAKGDQYPIRVCAVGEGLVFAAANISVVVQPATTQPANTQPATRPVDAAPAETQPKG